MHVHFGLLASVVWQSLCARPFKPIQAVGLIAGASAYVVFELWLSLCLALDYLFFPGFRRAVVKEPLFIIGNPRSGTSHLFRLISLDEERFTSFTLLDLLFPALTQRACIAALRRIDPYLGRPFHRLRERMEQRFFVPRDKMHRLRFNEPEEDDFLSVHMFASPVLVVAFRSAQPLAKLARFDELPASFRHGVFRFYQACLQRHLYWTGQGRALLSKNPSFTAKICTLREVFPDAKFVYILRSPEIAIASVHSMFASATMRHSGQAPDPQHLLRVYETMCYLYRYAFDQLPRLPTEAYCMVTYDQLVADPEQLVREIYNALGLTRSPQFDQRLAEATVESKLYRSKHRYSLETSGLTAEQVRQALPFIYERYQFQEAVESSPPVAAAT